MDACGGDPGKLLPAGSPQGWGEAADGVRRFVWGGLLWSGLGVGPWESSTERSNLTSVCCSSASNSLLELELQGSSRGRGKTESFFAMDAWKSEACDLPKNRNWCNCPQNGKLLIIRSAAHGIAASPGVMTGAITPQAFFFCLFFFFDISV